MNFYDFHITPALKRGLYFIGTALAILGIVFIALRLYDYSGTIDFSHFNTSSWITISSACSCFLPWQFTAGFTWWNLLKQFGANVSCSWAIKIHGISQLAKYAPGNVFHLAGRQAMGMAAGVSGKALAKSTLWELGFSAIAAGFFVLSGFTAEMVRLSVLVSVGHLQYS